MTTETSDAHDPASYAIDVADSSYQWYVVAAKRSRRLHRATELTAVLLSASVPLAAVLVPDRPQITAVLGSALVIVVGARSIFNWQENYLRFSQVREAVVEQRRLYHVRAWPYGSSDRDAELVKAVTRIERDEMSQWVRVANKGTDQGPSISG